MLLNSLVFFPIACHFVIATCHALPSTTSSSQGPLGSFTTDYGSDHIKVSSSKKDLTLTLDALGNGARLSGPAKSKGTFCATLDIKVYPGAAFAMYVSSGEGTPKHDELDFEFVDSVAPGKVWVNVFHADVDMIKRGKNPVSTGSGSVGGKRYCIDWKIGKQAVWNVNGRQVFSYSLKGWTKDLKPYFSYWGTSIAGGSADAWGGFLGPARKQSPATLSGTARDVNYS